MFLKFRTLNLRIFNAIGAADIAARNRTSDKIVLSKQVFFTFCKKKKKKSLEGTGKKANLLCPVKVTIIICNYVKHADKTVANKCNFCNLQR